MSKLITTLGAFFTLSCLPVTAQQENGAGGQKAAPAKAAADGDVEKMMIGHWAPDPEAMMKEIEKQLGDGAAQALPIIQAMMQNMAVEVSKGEISIHAMGEKQTATYVITKVDKASNRLNMQVTDEDGKTEGVATISIKDKVKTLTLQREGEKIVLNSISASEFEKRKTAAAQPPAIPGLE